MADKTKIEWTDATWNPVTGCQVTSPGCKNCYSMRLAGTRLRHHLGRLLPVAIQAQHPRRVIRDPPARPECRQDAQDRLWLASPSRVSGPALACARPPGVDGADRRVTEGHV